MAIDTSRTMIDRPFAGAVRRFQLRYGEITTLERICGAGIGEIMLRLGTHRFAAREIWETIRLGLEGGGMAEPDATATVMPYQNTALATHLQLAADILSAAVTGIPASGKETGPENTDPATSAPSTKPARGRASGPSKSAA